MTDSRKDHEGPKEKKINVQAAILGAAAQFVQLKLENLGKGVPGVDQAIVALRKIGIGSPGTLATLDGLTKYIIRESPLLPPVWKDFVEDLTDPFLDRARMLGYEAPRPVVEKAIEDVKKNAEGLAKGMKIFLDREKAYRQLEDQLSPDRRDVLVLLTSFMQAFDNESFEAWKSLKDQIGTSERFNYVLDMTVTVLDLIPDPVNIPDPLPSGYTRDEFIRIWKKERKIIQYLRSIAKPSSPLDIGKMILQGKTPPEIALVKERLEERKQAAADSAAAYTEAIEIIDELYG